MTAIGEIFEIPDSVHQGDFVLRLTEGVQDDRRKQTLQQYVVTPQLAQCFDQALSLIESAVTNNSSKGAYLHGSFGSGKSQCMAVLKQAYGVAQGTESHIDTTHALDEHFLSMHHGLRLQPPPGGEFKPSLEHLLDQALSSQYPAHPKFETEVKPGGLRRAWAVLEQAVDTPDGRYGMERSHREEIKGIVQPLKLADCGEGQLVLSDHWRNHIGQMMARDEVTTPTVRQLREWIDEPEPMGLDEDIADLIILTWAAQTGRSLFLHNTSIPGEIGKLNREAELREQACLPRTSGKKRLIGPPTFSARPAPVRGVTPATCRH